MTEADTTRREPITFSLRTMILLVTIACLATALMVTGLRLWNSERELRATRPLSSRQVARQFEKMTTLGPMKTKVKDVRYSHEKDSYHVEFTFTNTNDGRTWHTSVYLNGDTYGGYGGTIGSSLFYEPLGYKDGYHISVRSPSSF